MLGIVYRTGNKFHAIIESDGQYSGKVKQKPGHVRLWG